MTDFKDQMSTNRKGVFASMTEAPSAAAFGEGPAWIGGRLYWSNGTSYALAGPAPTVQAPKNYNVAMIGDSLAYGQLSSLGTTNNPITVTGGLCTLSGPTMDAGVGNTVIIDWTENESLNQRKCIVTRQLTRTSIEFQPVGYTPPDGTIAKSASTSIDVTMPRYRNIQSYFDFANGLLGAPFVQTEFLARNGWRVDELLAKLPSRIIEWDCGWAWVSIGVNSVNATDTYGNMDTVWAQMQQIYEMCFAAGMCVIIPTLPPVNTSTWASGDGRRPRLLYINSKIRKYAAANPHRAVLVDVFRALTDRTQTYGDYVSTYTTDGLHYSPRGAYRVAQEFSARMGPIIQALKCNSSIASDITGETCRFDSYSNLNAAGFGSFASQLLPNQSFQGTAGTSGTGITGSTPDSWIFERRSGTPTATIAAAASPTGAGNELTLTITAGTAGDATQFRQNVTGLDGYAGRNVRAGVMMDISSATNLKHVQLYLTQTINNTTSGTSLPFAAAMSNNQPSSATGLINIAGRFAVVTDDFVMQATSNGITQFLIICEFWGPGGATVKISDPYIILVD